MKRRQSLATISSPIQSASAAAPPALKLYILQRRQHVDKMAVYNVKVVQAVSAREARWIAAERIAGSSLKRPASASMNSPWLGDKQTSCKQLKIGKRPAVILEAT